MRGQKLIIETPEKIIFSYDLADLGVRIAAYLFDLLVQGAILLVMFLLLGFGFLSSEPFGEDHYLYYAAIVLILLFLFQWGYFVFFETVMNGRTPGKAVSRIRVIRRTGERLDFESVVIRNLLRAADSVPLPFLNILGGLIAVINGQNRRLGDIAADTVVVSDTFAHIREPDFETRLSNGERGTFSSPRSRDRLSEKDLYILRRLLNERGNLPAETEEENGKDHSGQAQDPLRPYLPGGEARF